MIAWASLAAERDWPLAMKLQKSKQNMKESRCIVLINRNKTFNLSMGNTDRNVKRLIKFTKTYFHWNSNKEGDQVGRGLIRERAEKMVSGGYFPTGFKSIILPLAHYEN
jgi:hypothetical protein